MRTDRPSTTTRLMSLPLFALFLLPILGLIFAVDVKDIGHGLNHPNFGAAFWLSLRTTSVSLLLILSLGTPLAWYIAKSSAHTQTWIESVVDIPIVLPPAVVGLGCLYIFGRAGLLGDMLTLFGIQVAFSTLAVIIAQTIIAGPFYVHAASRAFREVPADLVLVARTLGKTPRAAFWQVVVPIARSGLIGGATISWARALGEFGATLLFAGSQVGVTQTMPVAIYMTLESDTRVAIALALVLVGVALSVLLTIRILPWMRRSNTAKYDSGVRRS